MTTVNLRVLIFLPWAANRFIPSTLAEVGGGLRLYAQRTAESGLRLFDFSSS